MKKIILSVAVIVAIGLTSCNNSVKKEKEVVTTASEVSKDVVVPDLSFGVRGNCEMCKSTIEKAANSVEGVTNATWDVDKKMIDVSFDDSKTDVIAIHNAIAASGYDTNKVMGNKEAYKGLPGCCQYDHEMEIN